MAVMDRRWCVVAVVAAALLVVAGCAPGGPPSPTAGPGKVTGAAPSGTVTVIQSLPITSLDATDMTGMATFNSAIHLFDTLLWRDKDGNIEPFLATSWSFPDDRTIRLKLRKDVRFHNGDPLTVDDVVYTYGRVIDPKNRSRHLVYVKSVTAVRALDDGETVEFSLNNPDATLLGRFSLIPIVPRKVYEAQGAEQFGLHPVGSGPWKFREWAKGQRVVMDANVDYWRGPPKIQTLVFRAISEDNTRVTELLTGNADLVSVVPPELATRVKGNAATEVQTARSLRNVYLKINARKAPFDDVRVRQALAHAIDAKLLTDTILGGFGVPTPGGVMGTGVWGHSRRVDTGYAFNPARARELLKEAGVPPGFRVSIISAQGRLLADSEVVQAIAGMLQDVGITVSIQFMDFDVINEEWNRKYKDEMNLHLWSNANNTSDADYNYSLNFLGPDAGGQGVYWSDPQTDTLIVAARRNLDQAARLAQYQQIGENVVQAAAVVPLWDQVDVYGVSRRLTGFAARSDELMYLYGAALAP
jgi:peptide/nickel transport system substrate-binding protein